jgi:hypothetical protein
MLLRLLLNNMKPVNHVNLVSFFLLFKSVKVELSTTSKSTELIYLKTQ